jgi:hypothetical protein
MEESDRGCWGGGVGVEGWVKFEGAYGEVEVEECRSEESMERFRHRRIKCVARGMVPGVAISKDVRDAL